MSIDKCNFCPVCGSEKINKVGRMADFEDIKVYACFECKSGFYLLVNSKKVVRGGNVAKT